MDADEAVKVLDSQGRSTWRIDVSILGIVVTLGVLAFFFLPPGWLEWASIAGLAVATIVTRLYLLRLVRGQAPFGRP